MHHYVKIAQLRNTRLDGSFACHVSEKNQPCTTADSVLFGCPNADVIARKNARDRVQYARLVGYFKWDQILTRGLRHW